MTVDVYGLKKCDTCRKVRRDLEGANIRYNFHDVREEPPTTTQVGRWAKAVGVEKLLNKSSTTWRNLPDEEKKEISIKKAIELMAENPTLMKRPIIERGPTQVYVGWDDETQKALA